jgi:hypothetical protein
MNHAHISTRLSHYLEGRSGDLFGWSNAGDEEALAPDLDATPSRRSFVALLSAFRATGGIERGADLAWLLDEYHDTGLGSLASRVTSGEVFGFDWRDTFWVPMFQFDLNDMAVRRGVQQVRLALDREADGWALATWFARGNDCLRGRLPVDVLDTHPSAVMAAACLDRLKGMPD